MGWTARKEKTFTTMKQIYTPKKEPMRIAAFMSGEGTTLGKILEKEEPSFKVVMIFTDTSQSNAKKIADKHSIPYFCNNIREFYKSKGHTDRKSMEVRKEFDKETAKLLQENRIDAVVLCGYMSLVTGEICDNYLTINVHPADLRIVDSEGKKLYAGCMGEGCVKKAIESKRKELRSSTHLVTSEVDGGAVLMVSEKVEIDSDDTQKLLEKLKETGDWKIYPETIKRLAQGKFWMEEDIAIDILEEKELLRARMRQLRETMDELDVREKSDAITEKLVNLSEYEAANTVMFYMGVNKEVHTDTAINNALAASKKVVVPVSDMDNGRIIPTKLRSLDKMKPGAFGIPEPQEAEEVKEEEIELVIMPGLAFDEEGNRIGYGLGFYDRFLKKINAEKIALSYEWQIVDKIRADEHDVRMSKIITEERAIEVEK